MGYSIIEADLNTDAESAINLLKRNLAVYFDYDYNWLQQKYNWYYRDNPFKEGTVLLAEETNSSERIGTAAICYRKFKIGNKEVLLGLVGNFSVEKKYRILGPAILLQRSICQEAGKKAEAIYGFPPPMVEGILKKTGYIEIGEIIRYAKVLNPIISIKKIISNHIAAVVLSVSLKIAMRLISKENWMRLPKKYIAVQLEGFDDRFDALWERISEKNAITAERTALFLEWRYKKCPYRSYKIFGILSKKQDTLYGYIIYDQDEDNVVRMLDLFVDPDERMFDFLLAEFIKYIRSNNMITISFEFVGSRKIRKKMAQYGFSLRPEKRSFFVCCDEDSDLSPILKNEENWFLTLGDDND